jgi:hypothetical protein
LLTALTCKERDMGMFDTSVNYDAMPIGSVLQSPINLEKVTDGKWIALDGRDCNRSDFPDLAPYFPAGVFTSTARTLARAPAAAVITVGTHTGGTAFVAGGLAGVQPLQASDDGVSWVDPSSTWAASTQWNSVIWANNRLVMAGSGGDAATPYVSVIGAAISAATLIGKGGGNTVATTGGTTTTLTQGLAYSPTLGRTVLCVNGSLATASGLFYLNDGATAWNACSGGSTADRKAVVWTGQKFIAASSTPANLIQISSDGGTFSDQYVPGLPNTILGMASDGNGTVVIIANNSTTFLAIWVSSDHGATWARYAPPLEFPISMTNGASLAPTVVRVFFANDKFFITSGNAALPPLLSRDGKAWFVEPLHGRGMATIGISDIAYKGSTYCAIHTGTSALTSVENNAKFRLPSSPSAGPGNSASISPSPYLTQQFIKARN